MVDFHFFPNSEAISRAATDLVVALARNAVAEHGRFTIALSGGSSPRQVFELLASEEYCHEDFWKHTFVFWGDDRAVGQDHEQSNYRLASDLLLCHVPIPTAQIFRIQGELGAQAAARTMLDDLEDVFGTDGLPCFDLALQGMGTDGHTASLFPGTDSLTATDWVVPVIDPPANPKTDRVTLTFPVLNAAATALFVATGKAKQPLVQEIMNDPTAPDRYPAARVEAEQTIWLVDEAVLGS